MKRWVSGLSLLEIVIALVILSLTMSGMLSVLISAKRLTKHSRSRTTAGELARRYLEPLAMEVRQDQWAANCLGTGTCAFAALSLNNVAYSIPSYTLNAVGASSLRRVSINIQWND